MRHPRPGSQHGIDPDELPSGHAVPEHVNATCVRRDAAADGCRVASAEIHPVGPSRLASGGVKRCQRDARSGEDLPADRVDVELIESSEREHDAALQRNAAADEARVATLRNDPDFSDSACSHDRRHLIRRPGTHDGKGRASEPARPVDDVLLDDLRIGDDVRSTDDRGQLVDQRGAHPRILAQTRRYRR